MKTLRLVASVALAASTVAGFFTLSLLLTTKEVAASTNRRIEPSRLGSDPPSNAASVVGKLCPGYSDLRRDLKSSSMVVVGVATHASFDRKPAIELKENPPPALRWTAAIDVKRVIKGGNVPSTLFMEYFFPSAGAGDFQGVNPNQPMIFFLTGPVGNLKFLDPDICRIDVPALTASPDCDLLETATSAEEVLFAELVNVVQSETADQGNRTRALDILGNVYGRQNTAYLGGLLRRVATEQKNLDIRLRASAILLANNDTSTFEPVAKLLMDPSSSIDQNTLTALSSAIRCVGQPTALPQLVMLAKSPFVEIRRGAAAVLKKHPSAEAIGVMAWGALDDPDPMVRYFAVSGLPKLTGNSELGWGPSVAHFFNNEQKFLNFWREWRSKNLPQ